MLTSRGFRTLSFFLMLTVLGTAWGARYSTTIPLLGLTAVLWFLAEWCLFAARLRRVDGKIRVIRTAFQGGRETPVVWSKTDFRVTTQLECPGAWLPFVRMDDSIPVEARVVSGETGRAFAWTVQNPLLEYELRAEGPGVLRFEGVSLRIGDPCGFFYKRLFLRAPVEYPVLPLIPIRGGGRRSDKRTNLFPPPGIHRLRRPGAGSELLDLRDYRPGDPPKMIAWKPSARRGILITKEIESDVPVRCHIHLDASESVRFGPPDALPVMKMAEVAAGIARAAAEKRDPVGLTVFNDHGAISSKPSRTATTLTTLLRRLADSCAARPEARRADVDKLAEYAIPTARRLYPDLCAKSVNSRPFGLFWRPITDTRFVWLLVFILFLGVLRSPWPVPSFQVHLPFIGEISHSGPLMATQKSWLNTVASVLREVKPPPKMSFWGKLAIYAAVGLPLLYLPNFLAGATWIIHGMSGFLPGRARRRSRRKELAALYALQDQASPVMIERYLHDDEAFAARTRRFLALHRVRIPPEFLDEEGNPLRTGTGKVAVIASHISRSVAHARDNELHVILADLLEVEDDLEPLLRTIKVARARHHQVLVLLPWPSGLPTASTEANAPLTINSLVEEVFANDYEKCYERVRRELARVGATTSKISDVEPAALALERLDRLRAARITR